MGKVTIRKKTGAPSSTLPYGELGIAENSLFFGNKENIPVRIANQIISCETSTAAATPAKVIAISDYVLNAGDMFAVKFLLGNTANAITLNINGVGAKPVKLSGGAPTAASGTGAAYSVVNGTMMVYYDGAEFNLFGSQDTTDANTTYTAGNGLNLSSTTFSLGTPSTLTASTTNALTTSSHTHNITGFLPSTGGTITGDLAIRANDTDKFITFDYNGTGTYSWRLGYLGTGSGNENRLVIQSSKSSSGVYHDALTFGLDTLIGDFAVTPTVSGTAISLNGHTHDYAPTGRSITAGNGLSGGGTLAANRTVTLGTPSTITSITTNATTTSSHTHALTLTKADITALGIPASDTNTTYSAGTGLTLTGTVFTPTFGTTAGTVTQGNDSRLSNARTPLTHSMSSHSDINQSLLTTNTVQFAKIGVGTASPNESVDIVGNARVRGEGSMKFGGTGASDSAFEIKYNSSTKSLNFNFLL